MTDAKLTLQPSHKELSAILEEYALGKPLNSEQVRLLSRYHAKMSVAGFDPVMQYYRITHGLGFQHDHFSFLLNKQKMDADNLKKLKGLLDAILSKTKERFLVKFTEEQWEDVQKLLEKDFIILEHGNLNVTEAPYFPGGVPYIKYFQWGNMLGIVKYVHVTGEKVTGNIHVYFENLHERNVHTAIKTYEQQMHPSLHTPAAQPHADHTFHAEPALHAEVEPLIEAIPELTPAIEEPQPK